MLAKAFPSSLPGKTLLILLKAQIRGQLLALSPLICFLPGLLDLQKAELNHPNLCVPIIVFFFFFNKSIRALITLYWGMTCKILNSYISTISVLFFEFPTISTVPNTVGL